MLQFHMKTFNYSVKNSIKNSNIDFEKFKNEKNILIQIFCGQGKENLKKTVLTLLKELPQAVLIGTTTDGEIKDKKLLLQIQ